MAALSPSQVSNDRKPFHLWKDSYGITIRRPDALVSASSPHVDMDFPGAREGAGPTHNGPIPSDRPVRPGGLDRAKGLAFPILHQARRRRKAGEGSHLSRGTCDEEKRVEASRVSI